MNERKSGGMNECMHDMHKKARKHGLRSKEARKQGRKEARNEARNDARNEARRDGKKQQTCMNHGYEIMIGSSKTAQERCSTRVAKNH